MSSKDDVGKSVHELQNAKRLLEQQLVDQRTQIEELSKQFVFGCCVSVERMLVLTHTKTMISEDAVQLAEDARLRLEVNMQAIKAEHKRTLDGKEQEGENKRRAFVKERRELEAESENERRAKVRSRDPCLAHILVPFS